MEKLLSASNVTRWAGYLASITGDLIGLLLEKVRIEFQ